jgi:hypothetical protein
VYPSTYYDEQIKEHEMVGTGLAVGITVYRVWIKKPEGKETT